MGASDTMKKTIYSVARAKSDLLSRLVTFILQPVDDYSGVYTSGLRDLWVYNFQGRVRFS